MNLKNTPTPELLKQIGKDPRSYVMFVFAGLVYYFVFKFTGATNVINTNCEAEKDSLRVEKRELSIQYNVERERNDALTDKLLKQNETINSLDSLLRSKLEDKTKENLQNKKQ